MLQCIKFYDIFEYGKLEASFFLFYVLKKLQQKALMKSPKNQQKIS
jgi:hypothetical protein